ncbi:hypothetical protein HDU85_005769 [Gaertneriomyces sp. JEL0708]|nr:hypothetical protein HDU85_005769 [Gaertneriomyces sp. JEL0708]
MVEVRDEEDQHRRANDVANEAQAENERLLKALASVDERVVKLLRFASAAVRQLASEDNSDDAQDAFAEQFEGYVTAINEIQGLLRRIFRRLSKSGILAAGGRSISYNVNLAGDEKDLELATRSVGLMLGEIEDALAEVEKTRMTLETLRIPTREGPTDAMLLP